MESKAAVNPEVVSMITAQQAWYYRAIPFELNSEGLLFFIGKENRQLGLVDELELLTGKAVQLKQIETENLEELLNLYYPQDQIDSRQQNAYYSGVADQFLTHLIGEAKSLSSSDIHIEAFEEKCRVRIRIDGMLIQRYLLDKKQYPSLINKIKIISGLDIAEKRLPQDGRIFFQNSSEKFDIRVSVLPTLHGEKIVLRLLSNDATNIEITELGFSNEDLKSYLEGIRSPNGILLISGPTGSGKTTTLYATLKVLNKETRNILTIEDPIEYTLEGINQVQLKEGIGLTFAAALRTFLRQDPDIIMLGEIRDAETASMAIRAALTGHLVLSTIHTNSAWGIVSRLVDMGVAPYLLANTLNAAVAQRLIRLLCPDCKKKERFDNRLYPRHYQWLKDIEYHYVATGCGNCYNTGYKGRRAIYEVIKIDEELAEHIKKSNYHINEILKQRGVKTLSENAFDLFKASLTSLDEIYSILMN